MRRELYMCYDYIYIYIFCILPDLMRYRYVIEDLHTTTFHMYFHNRLSHANERVKKRGTSSKDTIKIPIFPFHNFSSYFTRKSRRTGVIHPKKKRYEHRYVDRSEHINTNK